MMNEIEKKMISLSHKSSEIKSKRKNKIGQLEMKKIEIRRKIDSFFNFFD